MLHNIILQNENTLVAVFVICLTQLKRILGQEGLSEVILRLDAPGI